MKKVIITTVVVYVCFFVFPTFISAGEYELIEGKEKAVCIAYGKNLNSFKKLPHAMVCERKLNPKFTDFKKPEWKKLDVWENREIVRKMDRYLWNSRNESEKEFFDKNINQWLERLKEGIKNDEITISLARVDIDNDGKIDNVIQYDMGSCSATDESSFASPDGRRFIIFNDDMTSINENLSDFTKVLRLEIIIYKGRTYLDCFLGQLKYKDGKIMVFDSVMNTSGWTNLGAKICTYKYKNNKKGKIKKK
jgi:hypothetical protein